MGKLVSVFLILAPMTLSCVGQSPPREFAAALMSPFPVGNEPADIAAGDIDEDGKVDLVVANAGSNDITLLLGNGSGGFRVAANTAFPTVSAPHLLAVGDLNSDGHLDLALTSHDSNDVTVWLGDGNGHFSPASASPLTALQEGAPHNHGLVLGDVDSDGGLDIIIVNQDDNSVSVLLGDGNGGFTPAPTSPFAVGRMPYLPALGDVDGDGNLDIAVPNMRDNNVTVLLGDGKGGFSAALGSPYPVEERPYFVALADLNADQVLDLATTHADSNLVTILLGDGKEAFTTAPQSPINLEHRGWRVRVGDVDRDGRIDLVTSGVGDAVMLLLGDGSGGLAPAHASPFPVGREPWGIVLVDVNGDGALDIATANSGSSDVTVLLGTR